MLAVNTLIQEACEDLSRVGDGETVPPDLAASCEGLLNRAITSLNSDSYISLTVNTRDLVANGEIVFRKLEEGEALPLNTIDMDPPDNVTGVSRKIGNRYVPLTPSNPQALDRSITYSLPTQWYYGVDFETAPSGNTRRVGKISMNGNTPVDLRVYLNSQLPKYRLGDMIYLSELYHDLILYALEERMVAKYKLYSYSEQVERDLAGAMRAIDNSHAENRPVVNEGLVDPFTSPAADLLAGRGF
jgi:hypothetical protein